MRTTRSILFIVLVLAAAAAAAAQDPGRGEDRPRNRRPPPAGFWPTERMTDLAMNRISEGLQQQYKLDDEQVLTTRDLLKSRFPLWMEDNRAEIQDLMNQYFEALLADDAPTPEEVAEWAQRALPLVNDFADLVEQTSEDMRTYMTDEQQLVMDGEMAMFRVGMNHLTGRMQVWEQGGYDPETEWPRSKKFNPDRDRAEIDREQKVARADAMGLPPPDEPGPGATGAAGGADHGATANTGATGGGNKPTSGPAPRPGTKDEWVEYTENFIRRYQLDEGQQNQARRILRDQQAERDRYLARKLPSIEELERKLATAGTDEDRSRLRTEIERVNAPVDRGFRQLKDKLDRLPTRQQRAEAARLELETRAKAGPKPRTPE